MDAYSVVVVFEVWSPPPPADFRIIITGSLPQLGTWFTERPVTMENTGNGVWRYEVGLKSNDEFEYKYACYSNSEKRCVGYEQGPNRFMSIPAKLKSEEEKVTDPRTGVRVVQVKDVWSAVHPPGKRAPTAVVSHNANPVDSVAQFIQAQVANGTAAAAQQSASSHREAEYNQKLNELANTKAKLKEAQADLMRLTQSGKESDDLVTVLKQQAATHEARLQAEITSLREAKAAAESEGKKRLGAATTEMEAQIEVLRTELRLAEQRFDREKNDRERADYSWNEQIAKVRDQLSAKETELSLINIDINEFSKGLEKDQIRELVSGSQPLRDRIGALLSHLEQEMSRLKPEMFDQLWSAHAALRRSFEEFSTAVLSDLDLELKAAIREMEMMLRDFMKEQSKQNQVYIDRYQKQFAERKKIANEIVDLKGKIRVFGRARPFNEAETQAGHFNVLAFPEPNRLLIGANAEKFMMVDDVKSGVDTAVGENKIEDVKTYELDHIFPPLTTQTEVFEEVRHLIASVLDGFNVTVFAYGQTGSGKTHTMDGDPSNPGMSYRSLELFFDRDTNLPERNHRALQSEMKVAVSMLEIYNEEIRDLLKDEPVNKREKPERLDVRQSGDGGSYVPGLSRRDAGSLDEALEIMDQGRKNRMTAETKMNAHSSRSHMVFTAYLEVTNPVTRDKTLSKLHLVDLAGSERVSKSKATGEQLKEAMAINKSLSALGDVIAALTSRTNAGSGHVPYRNSKLTFLLQDSLCGNSRTAMFVTLSPSSDNYWETISALNFGARAASVELGQVQRNFQSGELSQLRDQVVRLQNQLSSERGSASGSSGEATALRAELAERDKELESRERRIKALSSRLEEAGADATKAADAAARKAAEKHRSDIKDRDDKIRELEELVKKAKKEPKVVGIEDALTAKEVVSLRRQVQDLTKTTQLLEAKVQVAESKGKKTGDERPSGLAPSRIRAPITGKMQLSPRTVDKEPSETGSRTEDDDPTV